MSAIYIETARYQRAVAAIAALEHCMFEGVVTADQVKVVLGEIGDIWPESIRGEDDADEDTQSHVDN